MLSVLWCKYVVLREETQISAYAANPKFSMCYVEGKVQIPLLKTPPRVLQELLFHQNSTKTKNFQEQIRSYNMMFAFTSPGAKMGNQFNNGIKPPNFCIQGQLCHWIGSMLPMADQNPRFAQQYIYDMENEI